MKTGTVQSPKRRAPADGDIVPLIPYPAPLEKGPTGSSSGFYPLPWAHTNTSTQAELEASCEACHRQLRSWQRPPNWSPAEWSNELRAIEALAALRAAVDHNPAKGVPFGAFLHLKIMAAALARYRQEWTYALRFVSRNAQPELDPEGPAAASEPPALAAVREAVAALPQEQRWLVEKLFWDGCSEAELAGNLGISQRMVSKRLQPALHVLRASLRPPIPPG